MTRTIKNSRIIILAIVLGLSFALTLFIAEPQPANAATELQKKANQYCNNKYKGQSQEAKNKRINCRKGFKAGHNGGNKSQACQGPQNLKNACNDGFDKGRDDRQGGGGGAGARAGGGNNESDDRGTHQCGKGDQAVKTRFNFGCVGNALPDRFANPIYDLFFALIRFLTNGVGIILVIFIIWAGIRYATSEGNPEVTAQAKRSIQQAMIALFLYIFTFAIVNFIVPGGLLN